MKTFSTSGTGSQQTLSEIESDKIPIYDSLTDVDADLANLEVGQIVATKDTGSELSAPVDTVQSGNMHAVTSNAVAKGLSYSTTEQKTGGVWIDGKPIYRKVIDCVAMPNATLKTISNALSNIDYVISIQGSASNGSVILPLPYPTTERNNGDSIQVYIADNKTSLNFICNADLSAYLGYVTVEYTKTTD